MVKVYSGMSLNDLKEILKQEVKSILLNELYELSLHFDSETQYLPEKYKEEYIKSVQNIVITRLNDLKNDKRTYNGKLVPEDVEKINELLKEEDTVTIIMNITVVYATYFLEEPIHNIGAAFPGIKSVYKKGKYYYCPVKKYHITYDKSLCKYCIAKIVED